MPHFDEQGRDTWLCQKCAKVKTGRSIWVNQGSKEAAFFGCHGNVCMDCVQKANAKPAFPPPGCLCPFADEPRGHCPVHGAGK